MSWKKRVVKKEISQCKIYETAYRPKCSLNIAKVNMAILVNNARDFDNLYRGKFNKNLETENTGESLRESIIESEIISSKFHRNNSNDENTYPLLDEEVRIIAIGTTIDLVQIRRLLALSKRFPNEDFGILCHPWQVEYYQKIFPNMKYTLTEASAASYN